MAADGVTPTRLLLYSRDPGPTNQLVAAREAILNWPPTWSPALSTLTNVFPDLNEHPADIHIIANAYAHDVWDRAGVLDRQDWAKLRSSDMDFMAVQGTFSNILHAQNITGVITGVEDIDELDVRALWQAARSRKIPVSILFDAVHTPELRLKGPDDVFFFPDLVVVPNHDVEAVLAQQGVPISQIFVARPGYLDHLSVTQNSLSDASERLRRKWSSDGAGNTKVIVLFASENASEMVALGRESRYSEHDVLTGLFGHLQAGYGLGDVAPDAAQIKLVIRPHPRDPKDKYSSYLAHAGIDVVIDAEGSPTQAALAADLVVGMDSALLDEATLLGKPCYTLVAHAQFAKRPGAFLDLELEKQK